MDELQDVEQWRPLWVREQEDQDRRTADLARRVGALLFSPAAGERLGEDGPAEVRP